MPNDELFVQVLAQIERHPETWDQGEWATECGTAFCFAGHTVRMTGGVISKPDKWGSREGVRTERGGWERIWHRAERDLGIPRNHSDGDRSRDLFEPHNSLADLYSIGADLLGIDETVLRDKVQSVVADGGVQ